MLAVRSTLFPLLAGIMLGVHICLVNFYPSDYDKLKSRFKNIALSNHMSNKTEILMESPWNSTIADKLFDEIKVLCWIMMGAEDHQKAWHVKNTWGRRCNKLVLMSSRKDDFLGTVALPVKEGRTNLWDKTKSAFQYIYRNHFDEYDWFLKAGEYSRMNSNPKTIGY